MPWDFVLIVLIVGVFVPYRSAQRVRELLAQPVITSSQRLTLYLSTLAFQWIATAIIAWRAWARGLRPDDLGLAFGDIVSTLSVAVALSATFSLTQFASFRRLARLPRERQGFVGELARKLLPQTPAETAVFVALAVTVALCEEFLYRGFLLAAFQSVALDSVLAATFASSLFFGLAHLYQGPRGVATTFLAGLAFAAARLYTGSLIPCVAAHFTADALAGAVAPRLLASPDRHSTSNHNGH